MYRGVVKFRAKYKSDGLKFPAFEYRPKNPDIEKIEMKSPSGDEIVSIVHVARAANRKEAEALAEEVLRDGLNRISFLHGAAIENARIAGSTVVSGHGDSLLRVSAGCLRQQLEQPTVPGERYFSFFRTARQSMSPVEEFMHLYNILLTLLGDLQSKVDDFIFNEEPSVSRKLAPPNPRHPRKPQTTKQETIYTKLRNEFGHQRPGVSLLDTKKEMAKRRRELMQLTKRAIERHG